MRWSEIRTTYPKQWLVIEALEAHTENNRQILDRISVIERCSDGPTAKYGKDRVYLATEIALFR
jgi:hypothetical protein